ncbi:MULTISPECIES: helix-turn-helix domain-containing protein [Saccharomonospora]|uniref:helix-turn-helix domain-containing protein n=1 Tax=Saccharomonospora TaxID=1851 RepID=UPI0003143CCB|nr:MULTISPECIES: helix-turn-helix domain-containing protein [Saccharomonospora]
MPPSTHDDMPAGPRHVQFLTVAEVASLMRVSKMTVYRLVHSGELPAVRVGKSFRVPEQAVHDYLDNAYFDVG